MKIHIPNINFEAVNKKEIFILTRPFFTQKGWTNDVAVKKEFGVDDTINYVESIENATHLLIPMSINWYFDTKNVTLLDEYNNFCKQKNITAFGIINGDFGIKFPDFSNIVFFRLGGFKNQLSKNNQGFIVSLSDHFQRLFQLENIIPKKKNDIPTVGFCGHSTLMFSKSMKEIAKCLLENGRRFVKNPFRNDYEPLFASAFERAKLLQYLEKSVTVKTNFIYRKNYRGGAITEAERDATTMEYYQNINDSDYILCVRGAGNFSVRFFETLMMGKIPVFVDTNCLLPFDNKIDWKKHIVWVDWKDRKNIAEKIVQFHNQLNDDEFIELQLSNRNLWKNTLSVNSILNIINLKQ